MKASREHGISQPCPAKAAPLDTRILGGIKKERIEISANKNDKRFKDASMTQSGLSLLTQIFSSRKRIHIQV